MAQQSTVMGMDVPTGTTRYFIPPPVFSPVFSRTLLAIFCCGVLFCLFAGPLIATFTMYSTVAWNGFGVAFWYGLIVSIPFSIFLSMLIAPFNLILIAIMKRFLRDSPAHQYRRVALVSSACAGLLVVPILFLMSSSDLRYIDAKTRIFAAVLVVMVGIANQWAMRRHLDWRQEHIDFQALIAAARAAPASAPSPI